MFQAPVLLSAMSEMGSVVDLALESPASRQRRRDPATLGGMSLKLREALAGRPNELSSQPFDTITVADAVQIVGIMSAWNGILG